MKLLKLWVARDFGEESIWFYFDKPKLVNYKWCGTLVYNGSAYPGINMHKNIFPEVTFENSPQEVEIKLVNEL